MVEYKQPDPVDAKFVLDFVRKNRYQSEYSMIKPFLDEMRMLIFCVGSNQDGGNDRYVYLLFLDIPVLGRKYVYGFGYVRGDRNDDGSITSAEEADNKIKIDLYDDVNVPWWNKIPMIPKDNWIVIVSAVDWWNGCVNDGIGWSSGGTEFYCKLYDEYKKTYEQYWIEDNIYKPRYENDYTGVMLSNYISNENRKTFQDFFRDALVKNKVVRDDTRKDIIESNIWMPPDVDVELDFANLILQPNRGDYFPRPSYLGGVGFTYAPMTYMSYTGRVGLTLPENFEIDAEATRIWWWNKGVEEWNEKMNFVLIKFIGASIIPLMMGNVAFYSVFHKDYISQPPPRKQVEDVPYCFLRNKYFIFPVAENLSFEMEMDKMPEFPPLVRQKTSDMYRGFSKEQVFSRHQVEHPYRMEWEIFDFYQVFPKINYLHQTDYIVERLETRGKIIKGSFTFAAIMSAILRLNASRKRKRKRPKPDSYYDTLVNRTPEPSGGIVNPPLGGVYDPASGSLADILTYQEFYDETHHMKQWFGEDWRGRSIEEWYNDYLTYMSEYKWDGTLAHWMQITQEGDWEGMDYSDWWEPNFD